MPNFNTLRYANGYYNPYVPSGAPVVIELESTQNSQDAYVVKYDSAGKPRWAARIGGINADIGYQTAPDASGNV